MTKINQKCETVRLLFEENVRFFVDPKVEDITPPGGNLKCKITSNKPPRAEMRLSTKGDTYSFSYRGTQDGKNDLKGFQTRIVVTMPGKVIKADGGKIEGNKVIVDNLDFMTYGITVVAKKDAGGSSASSSAKRGGAVSSSGGVPVWVWAGVAGGVLIVAGGVVALRRRKRRVAPVSRDLGPAGFGPTSGLDGPPGAGPVSSVLWPEAGQGGTGQADAGMAGQELHEDPHSRYRPR